MKNKPPRRRTRKSPLSMLLVLIFAGFFGAFHPYFVAAELRLSVDTELTNTFLTVEGIDDWRYFQSGSAGLSLLNEGSRLVRGELVLDFEGTGGAAGSTQEPTVNLRRFYLRPGIGPVLFTLGKTRSTWGSGLVFNAGDLIFGSDTVDFSAGSEDPRRETAWLVNAEIPLGDFSFLELIALPGTSDAEAAGYDALPPLSSASGGARLSLETGPLNIQTGYLYRGDEIAGLGPTGHRFFAGLEGIAPLDWYIAATASTETAAPFSSGNLQDGLIITGGFFDSLTQAYTMGVSWRVEFLLRPEGAFSPLTTGEIAEVLEITESGGGTLAGEYGLYVYPSLTLSPRDRLSFTFSSILSPVDLSANSFFGVEWNIYEALTILGSIAIQAGETDDVFHPGNPGGISCSLGAKYRY